MAKLSTRAKRWIIGLAALDLAVFGLTLHGTLTYHRSGAGAPLVMPLGDLLGWVVTGVVLLLLGFVVRESRR